MATLTSTSVISTKLLGSLGTDFLDTDIDSSIESAVKRDRAELYSTLTLPKPYLSVSQIKLFLLCPKAYEYLYVLKRPWISNVPMLKGTSEHQVFEKVYQEKIEGTLVTTPKIAGEFGVFRMEENAKEEGFTLTSKVKDTIFKQIEKEVTTYVEVIVPKVNPLFVEKEVRATLVSGIPILGYIDLVHGDTSKEIIADYKISGKKWSLSKAVNDLQFQVYSMLTGIKDVQVHNIVDTKLKVRKSRKDTKHPEVYDAASNIRVINVDNATINYAHLNNIIEGVAKTISSGIFVPCALDSWKCTEKFCNNYSECRGKANR